MLGTLISARKIHAFPRDLMAEILSVLELLRNPSLTLWKLRMVWMKNWNVFANDCRMVLRLRFLLITLHLLRNLLIMCTGRFGKQRFLLSLSFSFSYVLFRPL